MMLLYMMMLHMMMLRVMTVLLKWLLTDAQMPFCPHLIYPTTSSLLFASTANECASALLNIFTTLFLLKKV